MAEIVGTLKEYFQKLSAGQDVDFPNLTGEENEFQIDLMNILESNSDNTESFENMAFLGSLEVQPGLKDFWKNYMMPLMRRWCLCKRAKTLYDYVNGQGAGAKVRNWNGQGTEMEGNHMVNGSQLSSVAKRVLGPKVQEYTAFIDDMYMDFGSGGNFSFQSDVLDQQFDLVRSKINIKTKYEDPDSKRLFKEWVDSLQAGLKNLFSDRLKEIERSKDFMFYFGEDNPMAANGGMDSFEDLFKTVIFATPEVQDYFKTLPRRVDMEEDEVDLTKGGYEDADAKLKNYMDNVAAFKTKVQTPDRDNGNAEPAVGNQNQETQS